MKGWLLVYDRRAGRLMRSEEFASAKLALTRRFEVEREVGPDVEVISFEADNLDDLKSTHGRYFFSGRELLDQLAATAS